MEEEKVHVAHDLGKFAEKRAAEEYIKKGYTVLERNWRLGKIEIDLIVQKDNVIVIVEVKARSGKDKLPIDSITHDKRRRMTRAGDAYLQKMKGDFDYRFDYFTLTGDMENYKIEILEDAFLAADFF